MLVKYYAIIGILLIGLTSCTKDTIELTEDSNLVFGHFYGECIGEQCIETFQLTPSQLFEDTNDQYGHDIFNFVELDQILFEQVKDLVDFFPNQLLEEEMEILGCPDCADQGGIFIQYTTEASVRRWRIDQSKSEVPNYLHEFMDKVLEKIELINQ